MSFRVLWSLGSTGSTLKTIISIVRRIVKSDCVCQGSVIGFTGLELEKIVIIIPLLQ